MRMKSFAGGKYASSHGAAIDAAIPILRKLERHPSVKKIVLGYITSAKSTRSGSHTLKITREPAGLHLKIRGGLYSQVIRVYTNDPLAIEELLQDS
jgi:hypothetical protein